MKNVLQVAGVIALLAWTAAGGAAWMLVKDEVHITVQDSDQSQDNEARLMNDRLNLLSSDLDALVGSLGENFELLAGAIQQESSVEAAERIRTEERLLQLEQALPSALSARETAGALAVVLRRLEQLEGRLAARGPLSEMSPSPATEASAQPIEPEADTAEPPVVAPAPVREEPTPAAPKKSFLAFRIPSRDFQFEGRQSFELLQDLSRVGFDAKSTLHDFSGLSSRVSGRFTVDLAHAADGISGRVEVAASSLSTGLEGRDEAMFEHLEVESFELLVFEASAFEPDRVDAEKQELNGTLVGNLTIRGVSRAVRMPVEAHVDESRRLVIEGELPLLLTDFGVEVPDKLGVISVDDEVRVWIHLLARAQAAEAGR